MTDLRGIEHIGGVGDGYLRLIVTGMVSRSGGRRRCWRLALIVAPIAQEVGQEKDQDQKKDDRSNTNAHKAMRRGQGMFGVRRVGGNRPSRLQRCLNGSL